ncbi:hypothetical protein BKI52_28145 [marine bacterium AO1-C]|nr:hypothetical protein BKI52_28145 [marine bacterium AO1-C]
MKTSENLFFSNSNYNLYYVAQSNILIVEANGNIKLESGQEAWLAALDKAEAHKISRWVSDESAITLLSHEGAKWWANEWFPMAQQRLRFPGKRLTATILSKRFYAEMSSKQAITKTIRYEAVVGEQNKYMEHLFFQTFEEAYTWLVNYEETPLA